MNHFMWSFAAAVTIGRWAAAIVPNHKLPSGGELVAWVIISIGIFCAITAVHP